MQNILSDLVIRAGLGGLSQILGSIARLLLNLFLAKLLGLAAFGYFIIYQAIGRIVVLFGISGIPSFLSLKLTHYIEGKYFKRAKQLVRFCTAYLFIFSIIGGILFITLLSNEFINISNANIELSIIAILAAFFGAFSFLTSSILMVGNKFFSALIPIRVIEPLIFMAIISLFIYSGLDINLKIALISWLISSFFITIYLLFMTIKILLSYPKLDTLQDAEEDSWIKTLAPLSINEFIIQGKVSITDIILGAILSAESVGLLRVAKIVSGLISTLKTSIEPILRPYAAKLWVNEKKYLISKNLRNVTRILSTLDIFILIILFFTSEIVISFVFGEEYLPASDVLRILILGNFLGGIWGYGNLILTMTGFGNMAVKAQFVLAIIYIAMLTLLTLNFGLIGASLTIMLFDLVTRFVMNFLEVKMTGINTSIFLIKKIK